MRILLLTSGFNSLTQRVFTYLVDEGHRVSVEFDINDTVTREAIRLFDPHLVVAPYLKRAIPEDVWRHKRCIILHPGIRGDRGPSALDWAIIEQASRWGLTALQANAEFDAGDIWCSREFPTRTVRKSSLYRHEITRAAVTAVGQVLQQATDSAFRPEPLDYARADVRGEVRPKMRQQSRRIDWRADETALVLRKLHASDGFPGVLDEINGAPYYLYDGHPESTLRGKPGEIVASRDSAICRATVDGAVWIGQLKPRLSGRRSFKRPATTALGQQLATLPEGGIDDQAPLDGETYQEIRYREQGQVGYLSFEFYNGAMSTVQCHRLLDAYRQATQRNTRVLVLMGGQDFWSNGMNLNVIEHAESPADESWRNINAIDDLARAIIETQSHLTIAALRGNAAAGGVFLALTADRVYAANDTVLNPHYKSMGNLYGSEYWTYLLPRRVGPERASQLTENRLPLSARAAMKWQLIDDCWGDTPQQFEAGVVDIARSLARDPGFVALLQDKRQQRECDERERPLRDYRDAELAQMKLNFYGFDPSYHVARYNFVHKVPLSRTPLHLAIHR